MGGRGGRRVHASREAATPEELDVAEKLARKRALGLIVVSNTNNGRYKEIIMMLHNDFMIAVDKTPKSVEEAVWLLNNYKCESQCLLGTKTGGGQQRRHGFHGEGGSDGGRAQRQPCSQDHRSTATLMTRNVIIPDGTVGRRLT